MGTLPFPRNEPNDQPISVLFQSQIAALGCCRAQPLADWEWESSFGIWARKIFVQPALSKASGAANSPAIFHEDDAAKAVS